ncbi:YihY/virulence factor BrkB family protein [Roseivirga sp. BDSF3-8]|uniref:YihY/virulence factor BrkB family protein n=1 Tax=Roseivirga sp. BDSF3-8 TaxID=3241598 RepID=UPI003531C3B7
MKPKKLLPIFKDTYNEFMAEDPFRHSAIISFYSIFSMPALLIIIIQVAGYFLGAKAVRGEISGQIDNMIGPDAAQQVETMISHAGTSGSGIWMQIVGIGILLYGATTVFFQLQKSLNDFWDVRANPKNDILKLVVDRATSLGIIIAIGFILLISLVVSTALSIISDWIEAQFPSYLIYLAMGLSIIINFGIITLVFAIIYKVLPDVEIKWRTVWIGAGVTSVLFLLGKFALSFYFSKANPGSAYGAAGSIILLLSWVSYSSLIMFFGAKFTKVYARYSNEKIVPSSHAEYSYGYQLRMKAQENAEARQNSPDNIPKDSGYRPSGSY